METRDYLSYIVNEIHTVIVATIDKDGLPVTAAIDMMDSDDNSLYFLTAKGKNFLAFTAMKGKDTMSSVAVSIRGKVRELGYEKIPELFEKNQYMYQIYPTAESRKALTTVFQIYEGNGEWFDLSKKPIERENFVFGNALQERSGYFITDNCIGCNKCIEVCPQNCIIDSIPYVIEQNHCLHCGNCFRVCPVGAVERR